MSFQTFAIRVDCVRDTTLEHLGEWLAKHSPKYFLYEELGEKTGKVHYQGVVDLDLKVKDITVWRQHLKDMLKSDKKNAYSLAIIKKSNYYIYCTKDKKMVLVKGYTQEYLKECESLSYNKSSQTFAAKLYEACKPLVRTEVNVLGKKVMKPIDTHELIKKVCEMFSEETKIFDKFIIVRFVTMIEHKLNEEFGNSQGNLSLYDQIHNIILNKPQQ